MQQSSPKAPRPRLKASSLCVLGVAFAVIVCANQRAESCRGVFYEASSSHKSVAMLQSSPIWHHGCSRTWLISYLCSTSRSNMHRMRSILSSLIVYGTRRSRSMISSIL